MTVHRALTADDLARMSWWARLRYQRRAAAATPRPPDPTPTVRSTEWLTDGAGGFTREDMLAANRAYDRWYHRGGPALDAAEMDAYRAYKRAVRNRAKAGAT